MSASPAKPSCLIIGAGPGIGQAVAVAFAREGYNIALSSRTVSKLKALQATIEKAGGKSEAFECDAGDEAALRAMIGKVRQAMGDPEVLVYNAASARTGKPTSLTGERLAEDFRVNVGGALAAAQEVAPAMKAKGRGTILLTGGSFAYEPAANYATLSMGKAALLNLTYSLAQELGAAGIHVATVTVYGFVQEGTHFDPARIAQAYMRLHKQPPGHFQTEYVYK